MPPYAALPPSQLWHMTDERSNCLSLNNIDLWALSAAVNTPGLEILELLLAPDERVRASRFRWREDRVRFVVGRGGLRRVLSSYCSRPAEQLTLGVGSHGKPILVDGPETLEFNVSHSGDLVLIGMSSGGPCGVDIERAARLREEEESAIAERVFCRREKHWLSCNENGFFRLWVTKEAIVKALGGGLSIPLLAIDVADIVERRATVINISATPNQEQSVWVKELFIGPDYSAAVAALREPRILRLNGTRVR